MIIDYRTFNKEQNKLLIKKFYSDDILKLINQYCISGGQKIDLVIDKRNVL